MENHHFSWENPLFQWQFSIATLNYQRVPPVATKNYFQFHDLDPSDMIWDARKEKRLGSGCLLMFQFTRPGKHTKNYGTSPFLMGKSTISMAIFNSYVTLPESTKKTWAGYGSIFCSTGEIGRSTDWWFGWFFVFSHILGIIIPTDFRIFFFAGVGIPPTS